MPYINNFCFPPITIIGDGFGQLLTIEDYQSAIIKLQAIIDAANNCSTIQVCLANISALTNIVGDDIIPSTDGTTAGGYVAYVVNGMYDTPFPNPNGDLPPLDLTALLRSNGNTIGFSRYVGNGGVPCATSQFETFSDTTTIPESGADTVIDANLLFILPSCLGVISFVPLYQENITGVSMSPTGVITIPAQTATNAYYYAYVKCDNTVVATICIVISNTAIPKNRISGKFYGNNAGGTASRNFRWSEQTQNKKYVNDTLLSTGNGYIVHKLEYFERPLGTSTWLPIALPYYTVTYSLPYGNPPNVAAWVQGAISTVSTVDMTVYDDGVGGVLMIDADNNITEAYFQINETAYDTNSNIISIAFWAVGTLQLGGVGDAQPCIIFNNDPFEEYSIPNQSIDVKIIETANVLVDCANGKLIDWQTQIGVGAFNTTAGGITIGAGVIQYNEIGTPGPDPYPTTADITIYDSISTSIVIPVTNVSIAAGGTVGASLLPDGNYAMLVEIKTTHGTSTSFMKLFYVSGGKVANPNTNYNFAPLAVAGNGQDINYQHTGTTRYIGNDVLTNRIEIDGIFMFGDMYDVDDAVIPLPNTAPLDGSIVPLSNIQSLSNSPHDLGVFWKDNAQSKTMLAYKHIQFIIKPL